MKHQLITDERARKVSELSKEILEDSMVVVQIINIKFMENFETSQAKIDAKVIEVSGEKVKKRNIHGEGVGLVDACFDAMVRCFNEDYYSLDSISIVDFTVSSNLELDSKRKSDANASTLIRVKNSLNCEYSFKSTTSSVSHSSVAVVGESIAFFINAELAYKKLHYALNDAKDRGRHDLITRFQNQMSTLVNATSYEKLVESLKTKDR